MTRGEKRKIGFVAVILKWADIFVFFWQVVANCLSALQEIWNLEASSEEASKGREALLSKPVVYYLLNRYVFGL